MVFFSSSLVERTPGTWYSSQLGDAVEATDPYVFAVNYGSFVQNLFYVLDRHLDGTQCQPFLSQIETSMEDQEGDRISLVFILQSCPPPPCFGGFKTYGAVSPQVTWRKADFHRLAPRLQLISIRPFCLDPSF